MLGHWTDAVWRGTGTGVVDVGSSDARRARGAGICGRIGAEQGAYKGMCLGVVAIVE